MQLNPYIFRGYDIRGLVGSDLNDEAYYLLGRGYATYLAERRIQVCPVGHDNRQSSLRFTKAFIQGLNEGGIDTILLGPSLSQIVYFSSYHFLTKACAMVTASHNPKEYNGLKFGVGYSETMTTGGIQKLKAIIDNGQFSSGFGSNQKKDIYPAYLQQLLRYFHLTKKWKIVINTLNSSSGLFYPGIFKKAGCQVITQNEVLNDQFPHGTDPTDIVVIQSLAKKVLSEKADLGLAFDADGDRLAVVDDQGKVHWMDTIVTLLALDILENLPGSTIVYNNLCSQTLAKTIQKFGGQAIMWKTGHSFIKEKMRETGAMFGGELSGHLFFLDNYFGHDDAAFASLRLLSFLEKHHESLSQATSSLETYHTSPEIKLGVADDQKFSLVTDNLRHDLIAAWPHAIENDIDGVRLEDTDHTVVIRPSQNGPYITVRFEARQEKLYNEIKTTLLKILQRYSQIDWSTSINSYALK